MPSNFTLNPNFPTYVADLATYSPEGNETDYDYALAAEIRNEVDSLNETLRFHTVTLECGYYSGIQLTVEANETGHIASSVERRRVLREIERIADEYGFFEYTSREVFDSEPLFRYA